ncbi:high affinity copper uptake protein 1-like [Sorex araneus]|uniref:high affinity copper uptake protein 1-like n=1 Tax=Sorex araneus TaxID=42254 RepID=UPI002433D588|nr:high affinity copper uptake protein 1-like [Sorex araneus]
MQYQWPHQRPGTSSPAWSPLESQSQDSSSEISMMMPMTFYFDYKNVDLLFAWLVMAAAMVLAFVAVILLARGYIALKRARQEFCPQSLLFPRSNGTCPTEKPQSTRQQLPSTGHLQTALSACAPGGPELPADADRSVLQCLPRPAHACQASTRHWLFLWKKAEQAESQNHDMNLVLLYDPPPGRMSPQVPGLSIVLLMPLDRSDSNELDRY